GARSPPGRANGGPQRGAWAVGHCPGDRRGRTRLSPGTRPGPGGRWEVPPGPGISRDRGGAGVGPARPLRGVWGGPDLQTDRRDDPPGRDGERTGGAARPPEGRGARSLRGRGAGGYGGDGWTVRVSRGCPVGGPAAVRGAGPWPAADRGHRRPPLGRPS